MSKTFYMMVGIVGSGKSTHVSKLQAETGATVISPDEIRKELTGDMSDQSRNGDIFNNIVPLRIVRAGGDIIYDATNYNRKNRKGILTIAKANGYRVVALVMQTPFDECRRRNAARSERVVPDFVLDRMTSGYEAPDKNIERIDEIRLIN